jgi:hypothetical protein
MRKQRLIFSVMDSFNSTPRIRPRPLTLGVYERQCVNPLDFIG